MSNKKKLIKISAYIVGVSLFLSSLPVYASSLSQQLKSSQETLNEVQKSLNYKESEISKVEKLINNETNEKMDVSEQLRKLQEEKATLEEQINFINFQIQDTLDRIFNLETEILDLETNINIKNTEIDGLTKKIEENTKLLEDRLKVMYKMGDAEKIEILMSSSDVNDFLSRNKMMTTITEYDQNLIKTLEEDKAKLDKLVTELNGQKAVLEISKQNAEKEKKELETQKAIQAELLKQVAVEANEKSESLTTIENSIAEYEKYLNERLSSKEKLELQRTSLESEISRLEADIQSEIERAAREKAEVKRRSREARVVAERETARRSEQQRIAREREAQKTQRKRLESLNEKKTALKKLQTNIIEFSTAGGQLAWPAATKYISSPYGYRYLFGRRDFHLGIDLAAGFGTSIYAAGDGVVTYAGWMGSYGRLIIIKHGNGMETRYAHLNGFNVSVGQAVQRGQRIAPMGSSGNSTGPHLHFEVRVNGSTRNPIDYIR